MAFIEGRHAHSEGTFNATLLPMRHQVDEPVLLGEFWTKVSEEIDLSIDEWASLYRKGYAGESFFFR